MSIIKELYNDFKNGLVYVMEEYPLIAGLGFLVLGATLLNYQLKRKESLKMSEHGLLSWKAFVNMWAVIFMSFIFGIVLILRNIF